MAVLGCGIILLLCSLISAQTETSRVVEIQQGPVRGYRSSHGDFIDFFGIPYATAPTGRDKFKAAGPPPTWTETFEATNNMIMCEQPFFYSQHNGNCLVINVHVPVDQEGPLPVMFYIHGGGFTQGYSAMTYPQWLLEKGGVIVVTINYRLGALGFLCLLRESIPGNAAYKDQVAGLRWVQQNIASFGGNPDDVTIAGYSAGSISVEYLMLSPMATGLFHKAISESGSVLTPFSEGREPIEFAKRFVSDSLQETITDISQVEYYLLNASSSWLVTEWYDDYQYRPDFSMGLTFCVEQEIEGVESFLTESPLTVLERGNYNKVPYVTGIASEEGSIMLPYFDEWKTKMENNFDEFIPRGLHFRNQNEKNEVASRLKQFYFKGQPVANSIRGYVDFTSDATFGYSLLRSARLHALNSVPVYLYMYSYIVSEYPSHAHDDKIRGAIHCAQSFCVNKIIWLHQPYNESSNDLLMRDRLTTLWTDFAKHGVPMTETSSLLPVMWERMDANKMNYLQMDETMIAADNLLEERYQIWNDIYEEFYGGSASVISTRFAVIFSIVLATLIHFV